VADAIFEAVVIVNEGVCEKLLVVVYIVIVFMDYKHRQEFDSNRGVNKMFTVFSNGSVHIRSLMWKM
jgi:hypothetical protein